jgi:hypothetical protein
MHEYITIFDEFKYGFYKLYFQYKKWIFHFSADTKNSYLTFWDYLNQDWIWMNIKQTKKGE